MNFISIDKMVILAYIIGVCAIFSICENPDYDEKLEIVMSDVEYDTDYTEYGHSDSDSETNVEDEPS